jgi:hypothetical protein
MRITPSRRFRAAGVCGEQRPRRYGYRLRCLEPEAHDGPHRWTPELVDAPARRGGSRPPISRATAHVVERVGRLLD